MLFRQKLPILYEHVRSSVNSELETNLPESDAISFTTDLWTSRNNDGYLSATIHFVDTFWCMRKFTLACQPFTGSHTAERIARALDDIIRDIPGLKEDCLKIAVHDAGANVRSAAAKSTLLDESILCADHRMNLVLSHATDRTLGVKATLDKAQELASATHWSSLKQQLIKQTCIRLKGKIIRIKMDFFRM